MNTPKNEKLSDHRSPELAAILTVSELIHQAKKLQLSSPEDYANGLDSLNMLTKAYQAETMAHIACSSFFEADHAGTTYITKPGTLEGIVLGFKDFNEVISIIGDKYAEVKYNNTLALGLSAGNKSFDTGYSSGNYTQNYYIPVAAIKSASSLIDLSRMMHYSKSITHIEGFERIKTVIENAKDKLDPKSYFYDYEKISRLEPWDFKNENIGMLALRHIKIDVLADRAKVISTDPKNNKPIHIDLKNFEFSGYYTGISPLDYTKNRKPNFVFDHHASINKMVNEMMDSDPTNKAPLVYVPVSKRVELSIKLPQE